MSTTIIDELLLASSEVEIQATAGKPPSVSIIAYTGGLMTVPGWGPVAIDLAGLDAGAEQISLLADHDATLDGIVGHGRAQVIDGKLLVNGTITGATEAARQVVELAKGGFKFQASVGVAPTEYERVRPNDTVQVNGRAITAGRSGFTLVKAGVLREVSIVVLAADRGTSVAIAAQRKESTMNEHGTMTDPAIIAETERVHAIRAACGGRFNDIEERAIVEGWDVCRTRLEVLRASRPQVTTINSRSFAPTRQTLEAAVLAHMGYEHLAEKHLGATAAQQARDLRATNLIDLCRAALELDGRDVPNGRDAERNRQQLVATCTDPDLLAHAAALAEKRRQANDRKHALMQAINNQRGPTSYRVGDAEAGVFQGTQEQRENARRAEAKVAWVETTTFLANAWTNFVSIL